MARGWQFSVPCPRSLPCRGTCQALTARTGRVLTCLLPAPGNAHPKPFCLAGAWVCTASCPAGGSYSHGNRRLLPVWGSFQNTLPSRGRPGCPLCWGWMRFRPCREGLGSRTGRGFRVEHPQCWVPGGPRVAPAVGGARFGFDSFAICRLGPVAPGCLVHDAGNILWDLS